MNQSNKRLISNLKIMENINLKVSVGRLHVQSLIHQIASQTLFDGDDASYSELYQHNISNNNHLNGFASN